jgi:hypothetical protein
MLLATSNAQGELSAIERGMHALRSGVDLKACAASVGREKEYRTVVNEVWAAEVADAVARVCNDLSGQFCTLPGDPRCAAVRRAVIPGYTAPLRRNHPLVPGHPECPYRLLPFFGRIRSHGAALRCPIEIDRRDPPRLRA